jgi:hypothetical protein
LTAFHSQGFEEVLAVHIIEIDVLLPISPAHNVVRWLRDIRIFDSELARYEWELAAWALRNQV